MLTWMSKKEWGSEGRTHRAGATIRGTDWKFTVDQPRLGFWVARGWKDGDFMFYAESSTMTTAKGLCEGVVTNELKG